MITLIGGSGSLAGEGGPIESICWQNHKIPTNTMPVVVLTTTTQFGAAHGGDIRATHRGDKANNTKLQTVLETVLEAALRQLAAGSVQRLRSLREGIVEHKINYWKYSRVLQPVNADGGSCLLLDQGLALAGDYLTRSDFSGCVQSAEAAVQAVLAVAQPKPAIPRAVVSGGSRRSILVVGAGLTGTLAAQQLKQALPGSHVTVWEMARGAGGRTTTARSNSTDAKADMGALVLSGVHPMLKQWEQHGLLRCESAARGLYIPTQGCNAIAKHALQSADSIRFETRLNRVEVSCRNGPAQWAATGPKADKAEASLFDGLILAIPPAAVLRVKGPELVSGADMEVMRRVSWSSVFSLALFYTAGAASDQATQCVLKHNGQQAVCQSVASEVIAAISLESMKRGTSVDGSACAVVLHSTQGFWEQHRGVNAGGGKGGGKQKGGGNSSGSAKVTGGGREQVQHALVSELSRLCPGLVGVKPAEVKLISWKESQVSCQSSSVGRLAIEGPANAPALVVCGDWLASSNVDGCLASAFAGVDLIAARLTSSEKESATVIAAHEVGAQSEDGVSKSLQRAPRNVPNARPKPSTTKPIAKKAKAEKRCDGDDGPFTRNEFLEYYGDQDGARAWDQAAKKRPRNARRTNANK